MSNHNHTITSGSAGDAKDLADRVDRAWQALHRKAEHHILGVCAEAAGAVTHKGPRALQEVGRHAAYLAVLNAARFAIEPVVAKIAGYETWAQLEADIDAQERVLSEYEDRELQDVEE